MKSYMYNAGTGDRMIDESECRPRHYAKRIMALKTREARIEALNEVPPEWRALVCRYVEIAYARYWASRQENRP